MLCQIQYMSKVSHLKPVTVSCFMLLTLTSLYIFSLLFTYLDLPFDAFLDYFALSFFALNFLCIHMSYARLDLTYFKSITAGVRRLNSVVRTSMRHEDVALTSVRRHFDVTCLLGWLFLLSASVFFFFFQPFLERV